MQRGRPAVASVFLCFVYMITVSSRLCSKDLVRRVNSLQLEAPNKKSLNCSLYTPTIQDYKQKCPSTTMKCFAAEMNVLVDEWEARVIGQHLKKQLDKLVRKFTQVEPECLQCEALKEENATTFLNSLVSTLQCINSQHCPQSGLS